MCSICGIVTDSASTDERAEVVRMLDDTRHRGPDACGMWSSAGDGRVVVAPDPTALGPRAEGLPPGAVLLAQSRLAITGTAEGVQPFTSGDGRVAVAHNGEIYNHRELASTLPGGAPTTGSDSEVLARLIETYYQGDLAAAVRDALTVIDGMYALAAVDEDTLVLARDPVGKKPIYYTEGPPFAFASERKALVRVAERSGAAILRLRPGHLLVVRPGEAPVVERTEQFPVPPVDVVDEAEALRVYEAALHRAVRRRAAGRTRAAVFFSGGVDSVLVARLLQNEGLEVTGYTMGMEGASDVAASEAVAAELGIPLKVARVDAETLERELPDIVRAAELGGPLQVEVSIPVWFVAKLARADGHRVVFTGQGADELFAGYDWYREVVRKDGHLALHARLWDDVRKLPEDTLEREDRLTMAHQLELRAPFLDLDLIRDAMRIAPHLKCRDPDDLMRKHTHRDAALRAGVPRSVAYREKIPAQDGADTCRLLELVAERRFGGKPPEADAFADFGSNYRYRDTMGAYASDAVHALLAEVVREHGILVADAAGEVPARAPTVALAAGAKAAVRNGA